ncbi:MAG: hypothetical protein PHU78_10650, partial [Heliobacteriaceae bacterium]|nr:hypothetical protein [Heliobacteriaceae bacterium]
MRRLVVLLVFILVLTPVLPARVGLLPAARAASSHLPLAGGIADQYDYQEYNFLTGLPLLLQGQIKVKINAGRDNTTKTTVSLSKVTTLGDPKNTLSRNTTFLEIGTDREDQGQTVHSSQAEKISESVKFNNLYVNGEKTGNLKFDLLDGQLSKSVVVDKHPVVNFFSGNFEGRKIYNVNNGAGRLTVDISGTTVGYDHNWGRSETQRLTHLYQYTPLNPKATDPVWKQPWDGQVDFVINLSTDRELSYQPNDPANISF